MQLEPLSQEAGNGTPQSASLDLAPPKSWRRFIPAWIRSLIWIDASGHYDAFLSYSWNSDKDVAPVIQSVLQQFLRPWYKVRAKTVFRDLSCLPAGSSFVRELLTRLDRSKHLIVLASPEAATSRGMELEGTHWFSREGRGEVLVIITAGNCETWEEIRDNLVPPAMRKGLTTTPLWVSLVSRRSEIIANPGSQTLRDKLVEDLKQIFLRLYPTQDWGQLRGEERTQRRRTIRRVSAVAVLFLILASLAVTFAWYAKKATIEQTKQTNKARAELKRAVALRLVGESQTILSGARFGSKEQAVQQVLAAYRLNPDREVTGGLLEVLRARGDLCRTVVIGSVVLTLAYNFDGSRAALGCADGSVRLFDPRTGKLVGAPMRGHQKEVWSVVFAPDGRRIVSASDDGTIRLWDTESGKQIASPVKVHKDEVWSVAFSPDGKRILSGGRDGTLILLDGLTAEAIGEPIKWIWGIHTVAYSPDGRKFAAASIDGWLAIWNARNNEATCDEFKASERPIHEVAFSPDSRTIITGSGDTRIEQWDAEDGHSVAPTMNSDSKVLSVAYSPDGKYVVSGVGDGRIQIWNSGTAAQIGPPMVGHRGEVCSVAFSPDGRRIISGGEDGTVRIWAAPPFKTMGEPIGHPIPVPEDPQLHFADFSADCRRIISMHVSGRGFRLWNIESGQAIAQWNDEQHVENLGGGLGNINTIVFTPDSTRMVSLHNTGKLCLWDARTGKGIRMLTQTEESVFGCIALSPDGQQVVWGGYGTVHRWDLRVGHALPALKGRESRTRNLTFSPNGNLIAVDDGGGALQLWDAKSGKAMGDPIQGVADGDGSYVTSSVAFSSDGNRVVSSNLNRGTLRILDIRSRQPVGVPLTTDEESVDSAAFSPDGRFLVTASGVNLRLWDAGTGLQVGTPLYGHTTSVSKVVFSDDGSRIVSQSQDGSLLQWPAPQEWVSDLCVKLTHNMTTKEWSEWVSPEIEYATQCPNLPIPSDGQP